MHRLSRPAALLALVSLSLSNLIPLESGQIGFTTHPLSQPTAVKELSRILDTDGTYGAVLWMAAAWFTNESEADPNFVHEESTQAFAAVAAHGNADLSASAR